MDASQLATKMLEWEQHRRELDTLESEIKDAVLKMGKTQTVGNVRASYSKGRSAYDYETAITEAEDRGEVAPEAFGPFTTFQINYRAMCQELKIDAPIKSQSAPSVSIKLLE